MNIRRHNFLNYGMLLALAFFLPIISHAEVKQRCEKYKCFQENINYLDFDFALQGTHRYRYWGFSLYEAAYYRDKTSGTEMLQIKYLRDFSNKTLTEAGNKIIIKNPLYDAAQFDKELSEFQKLYLDVKEGDEYKIILTESGQLRLLLNNKELGSIKNRNLAELYLGIWLSPEHGADRDLANALRGKAN